MRRFQTLAVIPSALMLVFAIGSGCKKKSSASSADTPQTQAGVEAILAKADAVDGQSNKVVSKCAACALRMEGAAENELKTHGYTMHFCSKECLDHFADDPAKAILAMKIPG